MSDNLFRDYCKTENSDDEDLQSRLYAEIYYTSHDQNIPVTNENITAKTISDTRDETNSALISNSNTTSLNIINNSSITLKNEKINIPQLNVKYNETELVSVKHQNPIGTHNVSMEPVVTCNNMVADNITNKLCNFNNTINDTSIKSEIKDLKKSKGDVQNDNNETQIIVPDILNTIVNEVKSIKECTKMENMFTKYNFLKRFINELYLTKYQELHNKLQELEEEPIINLNAVINEPVIESETDTKYNVIEKHKKERSSHEHSEPIIVSSDDDSESAESILEVPIPPKPQPPIINLQESDDDSIILNSASNIIDVVSPNIVNESMNCNKQFLSMSDNCNITNSTPVTKKKNVPSATSQTITEFVEVTDSSNECISTEFDKEEDIVLNCTQVQNGAKSIKEIREIKKHVQTEEDHLLSHLSQSDVNIPFQSAAENNSIMIDKILPNIRNVHSDEKTEISISQTVVNKTNTQPERDKNDIDISIDDFRTEVSKNNVHLAISKYTNNQKQHASKRKRKEESWEEYIFRPMPEHLKAYYDCRGQDNFDIKQIQSKMSKDPRLWTVLNEDLVRSCTKRQRFWNVHCSNCQRDGHQRYNCPNPQKIPSCHMCGSVGHTLTRCPKKICLTCGRKQATFRKTCESCRILFCTTCKATGHDSTECPDLWRRFHQTTNDSEVNIPKSLSEVMKPSNLLVCCNCTKRGHDSSVCNEYRWSEHFPTPAFVSSYTDGLNYTDNAETNTIAETKSSKLNSANKHNDLIITNGLNFSSVQNDIDKHQIIYTYGEISLIKNTGSEIIKCLSTESSINLADILKYAVTPSFLSKVFKIVPFNVTIYYNEDIQVMLRIRARAKLTKAIYNLMYYWLQLKTSEKNTFCVDFPRDRTLLLNFLISKISEFPTDVSTNLLNCLDTIQKLKDEIKNGKKLAKIAKRRNIRNRIAALQNKAAKQYEKIFRKNRFQELWGFIIELILENGTSKRKKKKQTGNNNVGKLTYLKILFSCNKACISYTPADSTNVTHTKQTKPKKKVQKKLKPSLTPYEKLINEIREYNANIIKQKQISGNTSTIKKVNDNTDNNKDNVTHSMETLHNDRINEISRNVTMNINAAKRDQKNISPSLLKVTIHNILPSNNTLNPSTSKISNPTTKEKTINREYKRIVTLPDNNETKCKKLKETSIHQNNESLVSKAKKLIINALEFQSPHISKSIAKVQKRLDDNTIEQRHIDVLENLVTLEKEHQARMTSFCNNLT